MKTVLQHSHTPPLWMTYGGRTLARWSRNPTGKLLILVHGFNGSAGETWADLPGLLREDKAMAGHDIVSYGYDSLDYNANEHGNDFHVFVGKMLTDSAKQINISLGKYDASAIRPPDFRYTELYLVGHSLGACVIRRALLNELIAGKAPWPKATKTIFYAPAHGGASLLRLWAAATLGVSLSNVRAVADYFVPTLKDLAPGSDFLKTLEADTKEHGKANASLVAPLTFWARGDRVVENQKFAYDVLPTIPVDGTTHVDICKPPGRDSRVTRLIQEITS